jgi:ribosomal protein S18 acetylase RimI-like enzyme
MFNNTSRLPLLTGSARQPAMRLMQPSDQVFVQALYASTRADLQMLGLPGPLLQTLLRQQQLAQECGIATHYPGAQHWVVEESLDGAAQLLGRVVLCELIEPHQNAHVRVLDLAVLPSAQRQGIAMTVLRTLQASAQAAKLALHLAVAHSNPGAQALYLKAGFLPELPLAASPGPDTLLMQMCWKPGETLEA